jgi:hypothetical protein
MTTSLPSAEALRGLCGGAVHLPGDPGYDLARTPWAVQVQQRPAAVAYPAFPDEVAEVLRAAGSAGLQVATQGTGHGAAPLEGRLGSAVLLRTSAMTELSLDVERRTAGVLWGDFCDVAGASRLAALHPSSPDVGVVGYSLGGGISWYARQHGLQCNGVTAVELVLADGTFVRATADADADLFWALRGGGAPLGVVTALEFDLLPLETVVAGFLAWDVSRAAEVLAAWARWCADAADEATTSWRLLRVPDMDGVPAEVRGRSLVIVDGAVLGADDRGAAAFAGLRALRPEIDTVARVPAASLVRLHLDPEGPSPGYASSLLVDDLPDAAIAAVLDTVGPGSGSELTIAELRQLGGAMGRSPEGAGALDRLDGGFLALGIGIHEDPAGMEQHRADASRLLGALAPWAGGRQYLAMQDQLTDSRKALSTEAHARVSAIRAAADPGGLFVSQHVPTEVPQQR